MSVETSIEHVACPECAVVSAVEVLTRTHGGQVRRESFEHTCGACGTTFDQRARRRSPGGD